MIGNYFCRTCTGNTKEASSIIQVRDTSGHLFFLIVSIFFGKKTWMICNKPEFSRYNFQGCFISYLFLKFVSIFETQLTKILPVPVCPEISSPAQSLASLMKSPSDEASGFWPWLLWLLIMARRDDIKVTTRT